MIWTGQEITPRSLLMRSHPYGGNNAVDGNVMLLPDGLPYISHIQMEVKTRGKRSGTPYPDGLPQIGHIQKGVIICG